MGSKLSIRKNYISWRISRKRGNSKLKKTAYCPICNMEFKSWQTYDDFNYHIDNCLEIRDPSNAVHGNKMFSHLASVEEKIEWVRQQFNTIRVPWSEEYKKIFISRDELLIDSIREVQNLCDRDMRSEFQIQFIGEIAMDAGGVMKEWVNILIKQLFSEEMNLFCRTKTDEVAYIISPQEMQPELYYFTGRILGKAIFENIPINCPLCKTLYKHLLDREVGFEDIKYQDIELYNSLQSLANNTIEDVFVGYFALEKGSDLYELKKNGSEISINEENKRQYLDLRSEFETIACMMPSLAHFKNGFFSVVPQSMILELSPEELEVLLCGKATLDLIEWRENTEYKGDFSNHHKVVKWFWSILEDFTQEELSQLLVFVTGTSRVPIEGFSGLKTLRGDPAKFTLQSIEMFKKALPRAHTCFNRLDLPSYSSKRDLKDALKFVMKNHVLGFGLE